MKKLFTLLFAIMASTSIAFSYPLLIDGWYYSLDWDNYTARFFGCWAGVGCSREVTSIVVPPHIVYKENEMDEETIFTVTSIGYNACSNFTNLTTVQLPSSIEIIEDGAFDNCNSLRSINIPSSVRSIGNSAFSGCSSMSSINLPPSVKSIGNYAFSGCTGLHSFTIPYGIKIINDHTFWNCTNLASIEIPITVDTISWAAFRDCTGLISVDLGNVTTIAKEAFTGCTNLPHIVIPESVKNIGYNGVANGELTTFDGCSNLETVEIRSSSIVSRDYNWHYNIRYMFGPQVKEYIIAEGITRVGNAAFYDGCDSLVSVQLPISLTEIGETAFGACRSLPSINIPNNVIKIGGGAFWSCTHLSSVTIGNSVTTIGDQAFSGCESLPSIEIPNSVLSIGEWAFWDCDSLSSVKIGSSVTSIGSMAFSGCNIHEIRFVGTIADWCSKPWVAELTSYSQPDYALYIDGEKIKDLIITTEVTDITARAFDHNTNLTSVHIPATVDSIAEYAFNKCTALEYIRCDAVVPPTLGAYVFLYVDKNIPLYVPAESVEEYKAAYGWKEFLNILPINNSTTSIDKLEKIETIDNKILLNDQILILRGDKTYTLQGAEVK